ncbi:lantibiotic immunity ABC transporter MutE/EpiE family permease subunit [Paenibacillus xylaniclasticus]|uniref:lantibiotic immunity ABC transporter MutE/EpiE family permease subunit n=1 Tax=Paenibacillus xylaniclasticus TaxID=588083 RepID=UPI0017771392|nr:MULTISPECIES: lantibiotic immunity ABC transporter MutE/EpiE family permease subunit [Paenibacillus]GFN31384.1 multidrug ABC transporter permease [Paenibacillus curdlanolyticus]
MMMTDMIISEWIKYKRSFAKKLAFIAPLFFILYGAILSYYLPEQTKPTWDVLLAMIFNWWPILFIPIGISLLCTLAELREKKAGNYRSIRSNNISMFKLWFSKITVIGFYMLLSSSVLMLTALLTGLWTAGGDIPFSKIIGAGGVIWLVALGLIPIHLYAAARFGAFAGLLLGLVAMFTGVLAAPQTYWIFVPWSWPIRLMSPMVGVHPNGVMLQAGDPLLDSSVIPTGLIVSLLFLIVSSVITAYLFSRREVR